MKRENSLMQKVLAKNANKSGIEIHPDIHSACPSYIGGHAEQGMGSIPPTEAENNAARKDNVFQVLFVMPG